MFRSKSIYKKFIKFVMKQPTENKINHETWYTCAVGEFKNSEIIPFKNAEDIKRVIKKHNFDLYETLTTGQKKVPDYGNLQKYLIDTNVVKV